MASRPGTPSALEASTIDKTSALDGNAPDETDFANYFCTYGYIYHQVRLLYLYH
jgi:hypothetical protein